jgi:hypothetical protein
VLIIRSPWQSNVLAGAIAWAVLFCGVGLALVRLAQGGTVAYSTLAVMAPGLLLTLITQTHWVAYRRAVAAQRRGKVAPPRGARRRRSRRRGG